MTDAAGAARAGVAEGPGWLETGVPGLDRLLGGGLRRRTTAMVIGAPGTGKTVLAHQIAFHVARQGGTALYLTGYSETHDKLLAHNRSLRFFEPALIGSRLQYGSLPDLLRQGAEETEDAIVATARAAGATLVVLDGFGSMRRLLSDEQAVAHFVYSVGAKLALLGTTTLLAVEGDPEESGRYPELTVCDVILALRREQRGARQRRLAELLKVRGAAPLLGVHPFAVDDDGVVFYPRLESLVPASDPAWSGGRAPFGVGWLDALLGGGLTAGTATLVTGTPGTGKTLLGLQFVAAGAAAGEPGLFLGFMENPAQLRAKARAFGIDLAAAEAAGQVRLLVLPAYDLEADRAAALVREDVERRAVRRLVVDSAAELERGLPDAARKPEFFAALVSYLRAANVTTYLTLDVVQIVGPALDFAGTPLSVLAENMLLLRHAEYRGQLHRLLSVVKMRFSDHDHGLHEYTITAGHGLQVMGPAPPGEGLLTGTARAAGADRGEAGASGRRGAGRRPGAPWPRS